MQFQHFFNKIKRSNLSKNFYQKSTNKALLALQLNTRFLQILNYENVFF